MARERSPPSLATLTESVRHAHERGRGDLSSRRVEHFDAFVAMSVSAEAMTAEPELNDLEIASRTAALKDELVLRDESGPG